MNEDLIVAKELGSLFSTIAHHDRIRIIEELGNGEKDVQSLSEILGISSSRVSQHLAKLKSLKLLTERRDHKHHFYSLSNPALAKWILMGVEYSELFAVNPQRLKQVLNKSGNRWARQI